jgi:hypothetical protein
MNLYHMRRLNWNRRRPNVCALLIPVKSSNAKSVIERTSGPIISIVIWTRVSGPYTWTVVVVL